MEIKELLESTPTVDICATSDETRILVRSKDVVADESGQRTEEIPGKGTVCSRMTAHLYRLLETKGFHTAFVEEVTDTESLFRREETIPLLITVRSYSAGEYPERTGLPEGTALPVATAEFHCTKKGLGRPFINGYDALAMKLVTEAEIEEFCNGLPRYKRPRKIIFDDVPRNPTGKIEKPLLRKRYSVEGLVGKENEL